MTPNSTIFFYRQQHTRNNVVQIPLARSNFSRAVTKAPELPLKNRIFERSPTLNADQEFTALFSRPGMRKFTEVGSGHIRAIYDEPGTFDGDSFIVSASEIYRLSRVGTASLLGSLRANLYGSVSFAATGAIEDVPDYLFIADGFLWVYLENGNATGHLEISGAISNTETVQIGGIYYAWTNGSVDTGSPAGTMADPWLVDLGATDAESLANLFNAVNGTGTPGTTYSTALTIHTAVAATNYTSLDLYVASKTAGTTGNSISTTETMANGAWDATTLAGGGSESLHQIAVPGDVGAISVGHINSYIIVVPVQGNNINGRFYWIEPGETYIDPLNFATAERSPDASWGVVVFSDRFWFPGETSTEAWVTTGDLSAPMQRFGGVLYDRGAWRGAFLKVKDSFFIVDEDGAVFQIAGGLRRITQDRPDIEELIRLNMQAEAA